MRHLALVTLSKALLLGKESVGHRGQGYPFPPVVGAYVFSGLTMSAWVIVGGIMHVAVHHIAG